MERIGIPTLASVYGSCLGGGCELAVFCDLVISSEDAKYGQPEIKVRVFPPIAAQIMPRIIGRKAAMDLILSGKIISAEEARSMGLVNRVVAREELESATDEFVKPYLKLSAEVLRKTKKAVTAGLMDDFEPSLKIIEDIYLNELMNTADAQEGLKAFLEKRKPEWKNE
jgi:cyclohexa-1,5-dienecarbonyl-CoA hydratase